MQKESGREMSPVITWVIIAVVVVAVVAIGYKLMGGGYQPQTGSSGDVTQSLHSTPYKPPPGAGVPTNPGGGSSGAAGGASGMSGLPPMAGGPGGVPGGSPPASGAK